MVSMLQQKSGVFRIMEALIAIFITFGFLMVFIPQQREQAQQQAPANVLATLRDNADFRTCVVLQNLTCINESLDRTVLDTYHYVFNLSDDPTAFIEGLPDKRVYSNALYIAGNTTNATQWVVRLYFWTKP